MVFTLFLLRTGMSQRVGSRLFGISPSMGSRYFTTWVVFLSRFLAAEMAYPEKDELRRTTGADLAEAFDLDDLHFEVFIDCHEQVRCSLSLSFSGMRPALPQECQIPGDKFVHRAFWSEYKQRTTLKFLGGISGCGAFTFTSDGYPGRITDPQITELSRLLEKIHAGGVVSADKGFMMHAQFARRGCFLAVPPKAQAGQHAFSDVQMLDTQRIARMRIHVERAFERAQEFRILHNTIPVDQFDMWGMVFRVCCLLTNYQSPLIRDRQRRVSYR